MEEKEIREQPNEIITDPVGDNQNDIKEKENNEVKDFQNGSLGKFKDTESLLTAYNNLQAEFTRKCQKLKELEEVKSNDIEVLFEKEDWQKEVVKFLNANTEAKPYTKEISEILMNDKELAKMPNALDVAWAKVIQKTYKKPDEVLNDGFISDYLSNNDRLKNQLLIDAIKNIKDTSLPKVMGSSNGNISMPNTKIPTTIEEAKILVSKLFE